MAEDYLEKNIRSIVEPLVTSLVMEKPKDPVNSFFNNQIRFMIEYLESLRKDDKDTENLQRQELETLRKEVKQMKRIYNDEHEDKSNSSDTEVNKNLNLGRR